jgi:hypothetical protein
MVFALDRRSFSLLVLGALAARSPIASAATGDDAMIDFDTVYIPPLFLTGSAPRSAEGPARANAALARLQEHWPALRARMLAVWPRDAAWRRTLDAVQRHIDEAQRQAVHSGWDASHAALEQVRSALKQAREARGMDYALDRFVAFHDPMEHLADAASRWDAARLDAARRGELEQRFVQARARWRAVEALDIDARALRLSPAREAQLRRAMADEAVALHALSDALRDGDAAALLKAAAATKPPFVRAYTAFGLAETEALPVR